MLASINTPSVWGKCHKTETSHVLPWFIFLPSLQYYFSFRFSEHNVLKLCEAIEHLHSYRFPHRDIKSDNIILTEVNSMYHPMLIDFGKAI